VLLNGIAWRQHLLLMVVSAKLLADTENMLQVCVHARACTCVRVCVCACVSVYVCVCLYARMCRVSAYVALMAAFKC